MTRGPPLAAFIVVAATFGCDAGDTKVIGANTLPAACAVAPVAPPSRLGLDPFYAKHIDAKGIPVLASAAVDDRAVQLACAIVLGELGPRDDVREALIAQRMSVAVIGRGEVTTAMPEYRDLYAVFPGTDWDALRGVGATLARPVSSCGEENLLCASGDRLAGEFALVQTFATSVLLAIPTIDRTSPSFEGRLSTAYDNALSAGLWQQTRAADNVIAYYSEGVQTWFDANLEASPPDGRHNEINSPAELLTYDPPLAALILESLHNVPWRPRCP